MQSSGMRHLVGQHGTDDLHRVLVLQDLAIGAEFFIFSLVDINDRCDI